MFHREIVAFFPKGVRQNQLVYRQEHTVNLPVEDALIHLKQEGSDGEGRKTYSTELIIPPFRVNRVEVPDTIHRAYLADREKKESPTFRFPDNLISNLLRVELTPDNVLHLDENMTDWS